MTEDEYWRQKSYRDEHQDNLLFHEKMNNQVAEQEFRIFNALKPTLKKREDGKEWRCLYGANMSEGIVGFGETPMQAITDFLKALHKN